METNRLEKTNTNLTAGSLKGRFQDGNSNSNSVPSLSVQALEKEKLQSGKREGSSNQAEEKTPDGHDEHTAFETFLSFAHNAVSHIPKINVQDADNGTISRNEPKDRKKTHLIYREPFPKIALTIKTLHRQKKAMAHF